MNTKTLLLSILSAPALVNAVAIYETVHQTFYVTVDSDGNVVGIPPVAAPTAVQTPVVVAPAVTTVEAAAAPAPTVSQVAYQYVPPAETSVKTTSTPAPAPAPATQSPVASAGSSSSSNLDSFAQTIVDYHNEVRAQHGVGPLEWDDDLANFASNYLAGDNCQFKHSGGPYGENIAMGYATTTAALEAWYDENTQYNYAAGQFSASTGHFTQMVWKGTTKVGCAQTSCGSGTFLVCEYSPRGNVLGNFVANVFV